MQLEAKIPHCEIQCAEEEAGKRLFDMYGTTDLYRIGEMAKSENFEQIGGFLRERNGSESYDGDRRNIPVSPTDCQDQPVDMGRTEKRLPCTKPPGRLASAKAASSSTKLVLATSPLKNCSGLMSVQDLPPLVLWSQ